MPDIYFKIGTLSLALGMLISSMEILAYRNLYQSSGLMNWETSRMRSIKLLKSNILSSIMGEKRIAHFAIFKILVSVFLATVILSDSVSLILPAYLLAFLSCALLSLRTPYGLDGSDQASLLVATVFTIYSITDSPVIHNAVHWFISAQLTLVYFTSGWNKFRAKDWRNGNYLWKLFSTSFYGMENLGKFLEKNKWFSCFGSMSLILFETFFFLYWIVPVPIAWFILTGLGVFHLLTAITMGLNTFFWAFLSMYPSAVYCRLIIE